METEVNGNNFEDGWTVRTLKAFYDSAIAALHTLLDERDKRYAEKFNAAKSAVDAAFASSEKAIEKSDEALKEYKAGANEIRAALDDWQKNVARDMITKTESKALEDKVFAVMDGQRKEFMGLHTTLAEKVEGMVKLLSAFEGRIEGKETTRSKLTVTTIAIIGLVLTSISLLVMLVFAILHMKAG